MADLTHVVIAVIFNQHQQVLISLRGKDVHQGNLWEFPGGKVEIGESALQALKREIYEELNITIEKASPIKKISHHYHDKKILLDVWKIEAYSGMPQGQEGQAIKWQPINELKIDDFPRANISLIHSLQLPEKYMITGAFESPEDFQQKLKNSLSHGITLVQLRSKYTSKEEYEKLVNISIDLCHRYQAKLLLNTSDEEFNKIGCLTSGLHLSSEMLNTCNKRPVDEKYLLSVSCHSPVEIEKAKQLGASIILLSPVKETTSHPGVAGIGWKKFTELVVDIDAPVYALGGMTQNDLTDAKNSGAQGVAAISSFWK